MHDLLMEKGADLLLKTVDAIAAGNFPLIDQTELLKGREPIHAPKIFKEDMRVDWHQPLQKIYNHIRGLAPFPAAWMELQHLVSGHSCSLKIFKAEKVCRPANHSVGEILTDGKKIFEVCVEDGILRILELQLAGKKRMGVEEFLRGFKLTDYRLVL